ncbi:MAG TPA: hypothetical protein VFR31_01570, partial [Thermoanaerobaculia bacterium]|nr:hypothetical protein [Thermoanaerobaculia bacterium]
KIIARDDVHAAARALTWKWNQVEGRKAVNVTQLSKRCTMHKQILVWVALLLALAATASPATAQGGDIQCQGTHTASFNPGLRLTPGIVNLTSATIYSICTSLSNPEITYGLSSGTGMFPASCLDLLGGPPSATRIITWNTGETSKWLFSESSQNISGTIVQTQVGVIVEGKFAGSTAIGVLVLVAPPLIECLGPPGVTSSQGIATLSIF